MTDEEFMDRFGALVTTPMDCVKSDDEFMDRFGALLTTRMDCVKCGCEMGHSISPTSLFYCVPCELIEFRSIIRLWLR
jgi:hypothetical protein